MADTVDDFATMVNLSQLALGVVFVTTVNHQVIHNHAKARPNPVRILDELMGLHKTPFTSMTSRNYMQ